MFSRIIVNRSLYKISKHILVTQLQGGFTRYSPILQIKSALHVKVYDKDAGMDTKRAANKLLQEEDLQENQNFDEIRSHRLRRRKRSLDSGQRISEEISPKDNAVVDQMALEESSKIKDIFINNMDADVFGNAPKEPLKEDEGKLLFE